VQRPLSNDGTPNLDTLNSIRALGASAEVVFCDLGDMNAVKQVFQKALDVMDGQIHVLINCAGIQRRSPSVDFLESDWDDVRLDPLDGFSSARRRHVQIGITDPAHSIRSWRSI
jgi:2-deoxy-D-gluconate 3-dehydrogenase